MLTYTELYDQVCRFANGLKALNIKKGDRVCIYMPMIPEAAIAMLACARIGAIHSVVFAGFSPEALKSRILDANCSVVITADGNQRGGKTISLKSNMDKIISDCPCVKNVVVVKNTAQTITWNAQDIWYHDIIEKASPDCPIEAMEPLFILYTSGATAWRN